MSLKRTLLHVVAATALIGGLVACDANSPAPGAEVDMSKPRAAAGTEFTDGYEKTDLSWSLGAKDAPVTLIEYGSFTCGGCGAFYAQILPQLKEEYIDTGLVRFEFRSYIRNQADVLATMIAECAGEEKFAGIKNLYFSSQYQWLNSPNPMDFVATMAKKAGINNAAFRQCTSDVEMRAEIIAETKDASDAWSNSQGVFSTPTVVIDGRKLESGFDWDAMTKAIEGALRT